MAVYGAVNSTPELDERIGTWLTLPEVADRMGVTISVVRRLVDDHDLLALRQGTPKVLRVPEVLFDGPHPLPDLRGTLTVLSDAGFGAAEALAWLTEPDDSLPGTPVEAIKAGRKTEIRRRAQALAF